MELADKKVLILGMGKTGLATARFLAGREASVRVTDAKSREELTALCRREGLARTVQLMSYDPDCLDGIDLLVPSPGVPPMNPILREAGRRGIEIVSEIELASRFLACPIVAITGSNGKTTTTTLIGKMLEEGGKKIFMGGNIGDPLIGFVDSGREAEYAVVEVSSFQLLWIEHFRPAVAILLNTTCDHLDYHGSFEAYRMAKERIFENQTGRDLALLNADEVSSGKLACRLSARVEHFSSTREVDEGIFVKDQALVYHGAREAQQVYPLAGIRLKGRHNLENIMASVVAARECGVSTAHIRSALAGFSGLPHRIEFVGEKKGISFFDDSKGTNVGAVVRALESFSQPIFLLLGGRDKDGDFETLAPLVREKVKALVLFGEAGDRIKSLLGGTVETVSVAALGDAILWAYKQAAAGDVVLLSPGCASFDEFADYRERGYYFQKMVGAL